ncbi:MAG: hypothetical protein QW413_05225 [Nitrososphaerota archaeon]
MRVILVGFLYLLSTMITSSIGLAMGVLTATEGLDAGLLFTLLFIGGILIAITAGTLSTMLEVPLAQRIGILFLTLYMFSYLIGAPEVALFTTYSMSFQLFILFEQFVINLIIVVAVGVLFQPREIKRDLFREFRRYFSGRSSSEWVWRFALASVLFIPIYYFFGFLFSPITGPYYNNPELGLGLVIPSPEIVVPVELGRGLLYAATFVPLLTLVRLPRWRLALLLGVVLAIFGAVVPQLVNVGWPVELRIGHGVEMVLDSIAQGFMITWILWTDRKDND